jgi:hypothetical protein
MTRTWVTGVVVDAAGRPAAGAHVEFVASSVALPEIALVADGEGRFRVNLPTGWFRLRAEHGGRHGEAEVRAPEATEVRLTVG